MVEIRSRFAVDDDALSALHARAFGTPDARASPWRERLERHSVAWVGAFDGDLVGFVHAAWDGGAHGFLLDTVVDPSYQRRGIGLSLVERLREDVAAAGCSWLHVDFEPHLADFYARCGFRATSAGLLRLEA
ncbi:GNAT family N-acetyltransferase [Mumia sp. Pv 4-285]|uniref:GNAT family N-acetyltransferase n=1 Tax=Mumia qirimensis TaxID=3234852 RepID=UPI00351D5DBB